MVKDNLETPIYSPYPKGEEVQLTSVSSVEKNGVGGVSFIFLVLQCTLSGGKVQVKDKIRQSPVTKSTEVSTVGGFLE